MIKVFSVIRIYLKTMHLPQICQNIRIKIIVKSTNWYNCVCRADKDLNKCSYFSMCTMELSATSHLKMGITVSL